MILTCPNCGSRFELPAEKLAPKGKSVKCTSCAEKWFQLPDPQELGEVEDSANVEDDFAALMQQAEASAMDEEKSQIPQGVKPSGEPDELPDMRKTPAVAKLAGFAAALLVAGAGYVALIISKESIVNAWPPGVHFYEMIGQEVVIPGEGLVFDRVNAVTSKGEHGEAIIKINGTIINLKREKRKIPLIEASLRDQDSQILDRWHIDVPQKILDGESTVTFHTSYPYSSAEIHAVNLKFLVKGAGNDTSEEVMDITAPLKTGEAGGENNPAPPADDKAHQSAPEASSKSPEHAPENEHYSH